MEMPDRSSATRWDGLDVVDDSGARLGPCVAVFADVDSGMIEWLLVDVEGHRRSFVPALDAAEVDGRVRLRFSRDRVMSAPAVGDDDELAKADEATLYRHYDVPFTDDDSGSLLPEGATGAEEQEPAPKPEPVAATPKPEPVAAAPKPGPVPAPLLAVETQDVAGLEVAPPDEHRDRGSSQGGGGALAAAAPLAGVGAAVAAVWVVLRARDARARRRRSLPARTARARKQLGAGSTVAAHQAGQQLAALSAATAEARKQAAKTHKQASKRAGKKVGATQKQANKHLAETRKQVAETRTQASKAAARRSKAAEKRRRRAAKRVSATTTSVSKRAAGVTGAVAGAPAAVAERGRSARRSVTGTLWDLVTLAAAGAGYVLGARAGRERYDELSSLASSVASRPEVQSAVDTVKDDERRSEAVRGLREHGQQLVSRSTSSTS